MYGSGLGLCFLAYFRLRNCRPQLASRKCLPPRLKEKKLGFFSIYLGLFPFGSVFNQVSISRLYISPTVRCTDSRWKLELNTLPKVKSLDKFKKTPLFFSQALEKHCTSCLERGKKFRRSFYDLHSDTSVVQKQRKTIIFMIRILNSVQSLTLVLSLRD